MTTRKTTAKAPKKKAAPRSKAIANTNRSTSMTTSAWQDAMKGSVGKTSEMLKNMGGGGNFISLKGGQFTYDGATLTQPLPVIVLDSVLENLYFEDDYDPDNPAPPVCFAISRDLDDMVPDKSCPSPQAETCKECWANKFGSAEKGKGKACRNGIRLAVLPAHDINALSNVDAALVRLPVTSGKNYKGYVTRVEKGFKRPVFGLVTNMETEDSDRNQFEVVFTAGDTIDSGDAGGAIMQHINEVQDMLMTPPDPTQSQVSQEPVRRKAPAKKKTTTKKKPTGRRRF